MVLYNYEKTPFEFSWPLELAGVVGKLLGRLAGSKVAIKTQRIQNKDQL
jgi:hypothetical protein